MKRMKIIPIIAAAGFILMSSFYSAECQGAAEVVAIDGMAYNPQFSLTDNLKSFVGKKVTVTLESGSAFTGKVKEVGEHLLHIERLDSKDFNDALISIDKIVALDARFWEFKR
ncbi:MAG: hypothetical protein A2521_04915 [Deltaproteobacteria bacterium RIFOXYD12_FULL_57_12]|nr:MAG: hypothetical protein A2521_04915 [Deltaproteobacteria bacterium RIFOXYD12_FULL_57_12]